MLSQSTVVLGYALPTHTWPWPRPQSYFRLSVSQAGKCSNHPICRSFVATVENHETTQVLSQIWGQHREPHPKRRPVVPHYQWSGVLMERGAGLAWVARCAIEGGCRLARPNHDEPLPASVASTDAAQ
jgi:hypothetical protein